MDEPISQDEPDEFDEFLVCEANLDTDTFLTESMFREPLFLFMVYDHQENEFIPYRFENLERSFIGLSKDFNGFLCFRNEEEAFKNIDRMVEKANYRQLAVIEIDLRQALSEQSEYIENSPDLDFVNFAISTGNKRAVGFSAERGQELLEIFDYLQSKHLFKKYLERLFSDASRDFCIADETVQAHELLVMIQGTSHLPDWEFARVGLRFGDDDNSIVSHFAYCLGSDFDRGSADVYPVDFSSICAKYLETETDIDLVISLDDKTYLITREICERVVNESLLLDEQDALIVNGFVPIYDYDDARMSDEERDSIIMMLDECSWISTNFELFSGTIGERNTNILKVEMCDVTEPNIEKLTRELRNEISAQVKSEIVVIGVGLAPLESYRNIPINEGICTESCFAQRHRFDRDERLVIDPLGLRSTTFKLSENMFTNRAFN